MANGDIIQRFVKKPKENKTIDENVEINGNVSVDGDASVTGTITGNLQGDVTGNLTGNVTGNVTGNLTGNVTGNADTATHAGTADSATTAGSATNDGNGDKIDETYLKLAGGTVTGDLTVEGRTQSNKGFSVKHLSGGAGTSGYMAVCDLVITGSWENQWIIFHTIQRGRHGKIYLIFNPVSSTDPSLSAFRKIGSVKAYIVKTATSTWRLFIQKTEAYDDIEITNLEKGAYSNGIQLTWVNESVASLPSGYTEAVLLTIDMIATNADIINATTSNPTTETAYNIPFMSGTGGRLSLYGNTGLSYSTREGTTSTNGLGIVIAGNNTAQGTAGNKKGYMRIYGNGSYFTQIDCNPTANRGVTIPNVGGTMVVNGGISDGGNGWYKVNMGAYTMYFSSGSIASSSYGANSWGTKEFSFPTGVTFNSAKMAFSGTAYADDRAVSYNFGIYNGNAKVVIAWKNQWSGTVTTTGRYNFILYVFP